MGHYIAQRAAQGLGLLLVVSALVFGLINLVPGGPAGVYASDPFASPEDVAQIRELFGLNQPLHVQYLKWLGRVVRGDWGTSFQEKWPVVQMLAERLPNTVLLSSAAVVVALVVSLPLALYTATHPTARRRHLIAAGTLLGISVPTFWTGTIAILLFAGVWGVLPASGMATLGRPFDLVDRLRHLVMPTAVLASLYIAQWVRYLHAGLVETLHQDFVRTAHAKGLGPGRVISRHVLRASLLPFITILVLQAPQLASGAIVTEIVFGWPGVGRVIQDALLRQDYPVVMGAFSMIAALVVASSVGGDIVYALADPRIRLTGGRAD
jgi:peptide/nickel transport system permease protein